MSQGTLIYNLWSSWSRFALIAINAADIKIDLKHIDLMKKEQKSEEHLAINPNGKVPAFITADGTALWESGAITRYVLSTKDNKVYPKDILARAKIDVASEYIRNNINSESNSITFELFLKPFLLKLETDAKRVETLTATLKANIEFLSKSFFKDSAFVVGKDFTLADSLLYMAYTVLILSRSTDKFTPTDQIKAWLAAVEKVPAAKKVHDDLVASIAAQAKAGKKAKEQKEEAKEQTA